MREPIRFDVCHDLHKPGACKKIRWMPTIYITEDGEITEKIHRKQRIIKKHIEEKEHHDYSTGEWELQRYTICTLERIDTIQGVLF